MEDGEVLGELVIGDTGDFKELDVDVEVDVKRDVEEDVVVSVDSEEEVYVEVEEDESIPTDEAVLEVFRGVRVDVLFSQFTSSPSSFKKSKSIGTLVEVRVISMVPSKGVLDSKYTR